MPVSEQHAISQLVDGFGETDEWLSVLLAVGFKGNVSAKKVTLHTRRQRTTVAPFSTFSLLPSMPDRYRTVSNRWISTGDCHRSELVPERLKQIRLHSPRGMQLIRPIDLSMRHVFFD